MILFGIEMDDFLTVKNDITSTPEMHPILDFYENSTILVTGGTGFVGKVLINKLLTSMKVKKIFMLIRVKDNLNAKERLQNFFKESVRMFSLLKYLLQIISSIF